MLCLEATAAALHADRAVTGGESVQLRVAAGVAGTGSGDKGGRAVG